MKLPEATLYPRVFRMIAKIGVVRLPDLTTAERDIIIINFDQVINLTKKKGSLKKNPYRLTVSKYLMIIIQRFLLHNFHSVMNMTFLQFSIILNCNCGL